jgi:predicted 3-demethylubiquinone-9 3-methyltransferase (glyoxalase superfamily)
MQKITPFMWLESGAKEAAEFYVSVFKDAKIISTMGAPKDVPGPTDGVMSVTVELLGQQITLFNGGKSPFPKSGPVSFFVTCDTQEEIDWYWDKLVEGGVPQQCGWLMDKYGITWQIVPDILGKLLSDPAKAPLVVAAFMKMIKFDIAALEAAANS